MLLLKQLHIFSLAAVLSLSACFLVVSGHWGFFPSKIVSGWLVSSFDTVPSLVQLGPLFISQSALQTAPGKVASSNDVGGILARDSVREYQRGVS